MKQIFVNLTDTLSNFYDENEDRMVLMTDAEGSQSILRPLSPVKLVWLNPYGHTNDKGVPFIGILPNALYLEVHEETTVEEMLGYFKCMAGSTISLSTDTFKKRRMSKSDDSFFLKGYTTDRIYSGRKSYHSHHGETHNEPIKAYDDYKIGVELEVEATSSGKFDEITKMKSNFIYMESDGSLGSYGVELITIPLIPKDAKSTKTWIKLVEFLSKRAKSWNTGRCGLHVHIGREILGKDAEEQSETIGKMLFLYHQFLKDDATNKKIYGRDRAYNDHDGKTREGNAVEVLGSSILKQKDIREKVKKAMIDRSSTDRYFDINLRNAATIEFRKGRGSINVNRIVSIIEYSELIALYSRRVRWEKISKEDFFAWCRAKVKITSPLRSYLYEGDEC